MDSNNINNMRRNNHLKPLYVYHKSIHEQHINNTNNVLISK